MVKELFFSLMEVSITIGFLILALWLLSPWLNKIYASRWKYWVWLVLTVRLIIPVNVSFPIALIPLKAPDDQLSIPINLQPINSELLQTFSGQQIVEQPSYTITFFQIAMIIWLAGFLTYLLYQLIGYKHFRKQALRWSRPIRNERITSKINQLSSAMRIKRMVIPLISERISSPMMIGFITPVLFLPSEDYSDTELHFIISHELIHFYRHDIWYKLLLLFANALHWFNPLVYLMHREANKDLELSCDDEVIKGISLNSRMQYSETILSALQHEYSRQTVLSTYFYGGVKNMKERFTNIMNMREKNNGRMALAAVMLTIFLAGGLVACSTQNTGKSNVEAENTPAITGTPIPDTTPSSVNNDPGVKSADIEDTTASESNQTSSDFLNSPEGVKFQVTAQKFARAFFSADEDNMKEYLVDPSKAKSYGKNVLGSLEYLILKWSPSDIKSDDKITASYQYRLKGESSDSYLSLEMEKINGEWKVAFYALEK